jgi:16S rRNA (guanine966-N2)-methyltransferase
MRIVGGKHSGRRLEAPRDRAIRPTADRAREAIFNLLSQGRAVAETGFTLEGAAVLDAFCGTGALGLEALSRGAASATFLDNDAAALALARENAETLGEEENARFVLADATKPPPASGPHGLVLLDPPYGKDLARPALWALAAAGWLEAGAIVVLEQAAGEEARCPEGFTRCDRRTYGAATISLFRFATGD